MTNTFHTPLDNGEYYFHVEGVELSEELREVLVEQSKQKTLPRWDNIHDKEIVSRFDVRDLPEIYNTIDKVTTHPAFDGCSYVWNAHKPEMKILWEILHPEAHKKVAYIILQGTQPNGFMSPHRDWETMQERRKAVMFLPLTPYSPEKWEPLTFYEDNGHTERVKVEFSPCYVADTRKIHGFENNDNYRAVAAIAFSCGVETLYKLHSKGMLIT